MLRHWLTFSDPKGTVLMAINAEGVIGNLRSFSPLSIARILNRIGHGKKFNPEAFFSVEDVRMAREGIFPPTRNLAGFFKKWPKRKIRKWGCRSVTETARDIFFQKPS
jgi:hypothetical protein